MSTSAVCVEPLVFASVNVSPRFCTSTTGAVCASSATSALMVRRATPCARAAGSNFADVTAAPRAPGLVHVCDGVSHTLPLGHASLFAHKIVAPAGTPSTNTHDAAAID